VEKPDGTKRRFQKTTSGPYYLDTATAQRTSEEGMTLVMTVADKKSKYPIRDYRQAVLACRLQKMIGYPSTRDFLKIVEGHLIPNCPVQCADIIAA
jgi:DNA-directed RNA polymerase beta' subunit